MFSTLENIVKCIPCSVNVVYNNSNNNNNNHNDNNVLIIINYNKNTYALQRMSWMGLFYFLHLCVKFSLN